MQQVTRIMTTLGFYCFQSGMILDKLVDTMSQPTTKPSAGFLDTVFQYGGGPANLKENRVMHLEMHLSQFIELNTKCLRHVLQSVKLYQRAALSHSDPLYNLGFLYFSYACIYCAYYRLFLVPEQPVFVSHPLFPDKDTTL